MACRGHGTACVWFGAELSTVTNFSQKSDPYQRSILPSSACAKLASEAT